MPFTHAFLVPDIYPSFRCKGGSCRSTCCKGWGISVRMEEYFRLLGMDCPPEIRRRLDTGVHRVTLSLPYDKGGLLDMLYRQAKVESVEYGETIQVEALCSEKTIGQVKAYVTGGWQPPKEFWED